MDHRLIYHLIRVFPSHPHQELFSESADDAEMREMAREEVKDLERRTKELDEQLKLLLLPSDPNDEKNVMFEIRAGTGGDEAAIWASDLLRLYTKYAESQGWQARVVSFDLGDCPWTRPQGELLAATYGRDRFELVLGLSNNTIHTYAREHPGLSCDVVMVDGSKFPEPRYLDLRSFRALSR